MELNRSTDNSHIGGDLGVRSRFGNSGNEDTQNTQVNENMCMFDATFFCQNVRGLNQDEKRKTLFDYAKSKASIIFFQETHSSELTEQSWKNEWDGKAIFSHGTSASRGCLILISSTLEHSIVDTREDTEGRFILVKCKIQGENFFLINAYAPNSEKDHQLFLARLYANIVSFYDEEYRHVVSEGDWNFTENILIDRAGGNPKLWKKSIEIMKKINDELDCVDIWRLRNTDKKQYTWRSSRRKIFSRIDRFYMSDNLQSMVKTTKITPGICSDHSAVYLHLRCNTVKLGSGMWKLNTSLLHDNAFVASINNTIEEVEALNDFTSKRAKWDFLKYKVKEKAMRESKIRAKNKREQIAILEKKVEENQGQQQTEPENEEITQDLLRAQAELDNFHLEKTKALIIQSRVEYYEEGEKIQSFFLIL